MIEKIAKAIREEIVRQYRDDDRGKCSAGSAWWEENVQPELIARAALEAMREPTEEMEYAVWKNGMWDDQSPLVVWQAMIDAALAEKN